MEKLIIWQDRNNRILWEKGTISTYTRALFGKSWIFCRKGENLTLEQAKQLKKMIKNTLKKSN